ncbi:hypothetical protein HYH02_008831 [Chlamydomonas schloesseri]|uniref:Uncharacterized protein n=1 Tax=Chlamydomonas schloesseri TaxID=2026947 RepID=A0A835WDN5_9CHLO|nr:hypothetical protein HYH02_008831 [Chlamydomonas schloesseri]|eukprot:KAG2445366.1 hypothetical protein HYH02_008831 [Chlamydomonas schloesseri]
MRVGLLGPEVGQDSPVVKQAAALIAVKQGSPGWLQKLFLRANEINLAAHGDEDAALEDEDAEHLRFPASDDEGESGSDSDSECGSSVISEGAEEQDEDAEWALSEGGELTLAEEAELEALGWDV